MSVIHTCNNGEFTSGVRNVMFAAFRKYMSSKEWAALKEMAFQRDNNKCVDCGKDEKLIAHHESYDNWGKANHEELQDLSIVCRGCHNRRHSKMDTPFWAQRGGNYSWFTETETYYDQNSKHTMQFIGEMTKLINRTA